MGSIKARLLAGGGADRQCPVLRVMDGPRNAPYRLYHTASADVLTCYHWGRDSFNSRAERGDGGRRSNFGRPPEAKGADSGCC